MSARSEESYGQRSMTFVDRFGVWLSQREIRRWLPDRGRLDAIEFGCGYRATQLVALRERLGRGVGVDFRIDPQLRGIPNFEFYECAIEEAFPRFAPGSFDLVMLISVLEHLSDPQGALESAHALLRPGGVLLVNVPTWRGKFFLEFSAFRLGLSPKLEMDDHKMYYDRRDLWPLLVRAGFKPSQIHLFYHKFGLNLFAAATRSSVA